MVAAQPGLAGRNRAAPTPVTADSVWYLTNRLRRGDEWDNARGPLSAGVRTFDVTPLRTDRVNFELRLDVEATHTDAMAPEALLSVLRERVAHSSDGVLVLHVHGYATSWDRATREAVEMKQRGSYDGPLLVFSWPAHDVGITWPRPGRLLSRAYWQDSARAAESAPDLARVIRDAAQAVGAHRLVVSAHSMGAQLLSAALTDAALRDALRDAPLRALVFAAPDVDRERFRQAVVPNVTGLADRVVLYGARDDQMLRISAMVHEGRPRAGLLDASAPMPASLEVVDLTDARDAATWFGPLVDTNHAFRRSGTGMVDLFRIVAADAPASCREAAGIARRDGEGTWHATDAPLPARPFMTAVQREGAGAEILCGERVAP